MITNLLEAAFKLEALDSLSRNANDGIRSAYVVPPLVFTKADIKLEEPSVLSYIVLPRVKRWDYF